MLEMLKGTDYDLKQSIYAVLSAEDLKQSIDRSVCVYHFSRCCRYENEPEKCRFSHDREVPSAICQFWLRGLCRHGVECKFLHRIPWPKNKQQLHQQKECEAEELELMLGAMFPQRPREALRSLLAEHSMDLKAVVATLLQSEDSGLPPGDSGGRGVCKFYLKGDCHFLDCLFSHNEDAADAVCKYWLWGYCARKEKCFYLHRLPAVDTQRMREQQQQQQRQEERARAKAEEQRRQMLQKQQRPKVVKPPSNLVRSLRLSSLRESFPEIPDKAITAAFAEKKCSLEDTERFLSRKYGQKPKGADSAKSGPARAGNAALSKSERAAAKKKVAANVLMNRIGWLPTGETLDDLYRSTRAEAERNARERNRLFMEAVDAYLGGARKMAKELSKRGRERDSEMRRLHRVASDHIFQQRNQALDMAVLDLHGLHIEEGIRKLKERIAEIKAKRKATKGAKKKKAKKGKASGFALDVLTGTGHHSYGGTAKLGPAIRSFAQSNGIQFKKCTFVDGRGGNIKLFIE